MMASAALNVPTMALPELLDIRRTTNADTMISGLQLDSRKVRPGDLFLALPGDVHDGRQFIEQAVANGAAAVAAEAPPIWAFACPRCTTLRRGYRGPPPAPMVASSRTAGRWAGPRRRRCSG